MNALTTITALDAEAAALDELAAVCAAIEALPEGQRHRHLVQLARDLGTGIGGGMLAYAPPIARVLCAAWKAICHDYDAPNPQRGWDDASHETGRDSIARLLGVEGKHFYATLPFRTMRWGDRTWIAAAVGCPPTFRPRDFYARLDIGDIILWDPRTNDVEIAGEHPSATRLVMPCEAAAADRLVVYADPAAFFRAWAAHRLGVVEAYSDRGMNLELPDGCMPGAFLVGAVERVNWRQVHCPVVLSGPGVNRKRLATAILASANLPRVEEADGNHG